MLHLLALRCRNKEVCPFTGALSFAIAAVCYGLVAKSKTTGPEAAVVTIFCGTIAAVIGTGLGGYVDSVMAFDWSWLAMMFFVVGVLIGWLGPAFVVECLKVIW